jgi:ABC-type transport system involved in multi-copper enzyme maturation permease subunit
VIGLVGAELLKLRKRWATYMVPIVGIVLMTLIYLIIGTTTRGAGSVTDVVTRFPLAFSFLNQFVFGLGSLLAIAYAAAIGGSDWSWGIIRVVIARGEGRGRYVIAKAVGLAIVLFLGAMAVLLCGIVLTMLAASIAGRSAGNPVGGASLGPLLRSIGYGTAVLLERCFIGFAVAFLLRSQLAGVVVGIVLYIGESILTTILVVIQIAGARGGGGLRVIETQWYQYLPFSIGNSLLGYAAPSTGSDLSSFVTTPVPELQALAGVLLYLVVAIGVAVAVTKRAEIGS